jgi:hypothetical protein
LCRYSEVAGVAAEVAAARADKGKQKVSPGAATHR